MICLSARNIVKSYHDSDQLISVLTGVDLDVESGDLISITGQSGCGKSTLLHILGLLDDPIAVPCLSTDRKSLPECLPLQRSETVISASCFNSTIHRRPHSAGKRGFASLDSRKKSSGKLPGSGYPAGTPWTGIKDRTLSQSTERRRTTACGTCQSIGKQTKADPGR